MNLLTDLQPHSSIEISRNMFHVKRLSHLTGQVAMNGTGTRIHSVTSQICAYSAFHAAKVS